MQKQFGVSDRDLQSRAKISHHTLAKLRRSGGKAADALRVVRAAEAIRKEAIDQHVADGALLDLANRLAVQSGGPARLAERLGMTRQYVGRVLKAERPISDSFRTEVSRLIGGGDAAG